MSSIPENKGGKERFTIKKEDLPRYYMGTSSTSKSGKNFATAMLIMFDLWIWFVVVIGYVIRINSSL